MTDRKEHYRMMTETPVEKLIIRLSVPTIISMLVSSIYNMADTYFVSQLGTSASAAVGIVFSLMAIMQAVGFTVGMGAGILSARYLGAGKNDEANRTASSAFFLVIVLSLAITVLGLLNLRSLMRFLGSTETILPYAEAYGRYILLAAPVICSSFVMNNLLRNEGKAAFAMIGITTGGILNIALDPIFIFGLGLGTAGAAIATALSQSVSFLILLSMFVFRRSNLELGIRFISKKASTYLSILKTGLPSLSRQGLASIATMLLNVQAAVYGDYAVAAMSISGRITFFMFAALLGFGQGFQPVAGFNYGAGRFSRVRRATLFTAITGTAIISVLSLFCFVFARPLVSAFRKEDLDVIAAGSTALRYQSIALILCGLCVATNMSYQATGHIAGATYLALCRQGIYFIPLIVILPYFFGLKGVQLAQPLSDVLTFSTSLFFFIRLIRELGGKKDEMGL